MWNMWHSSGTDTYDQPYLVLAIDDNGNDNNDNNNDDNDNNNDNNWKEYWAIISLNIG